MKAEIEIRGKDLTAQSTNTAKKNIRSVVEEAGKAAKSQKQQIGRMQKEYAQNAYREVAQAQRTGIATGTAAAVRQQPGIISGAATGLQYAMQGIGMGGIYNMGARAVGGLRNMFGFGGGRPSPTAHAGGAGGGGGGGAPGGGDEGVVGGTASKIAPALMGVGAVVGAGLGLINSIGKRHDELMSQQEQTYRVLGSTTFASGAKGVDSRYGLSSSRIAQQRLSYATALGNEHSMKGIHEYTRLAATFGLGDEEAGKTAAYLNKSGLNVSGAESMIRGQTNDKIQAKAYFEQLGSILEEASHQGVLSGMKDSDLGKDVARGLSALYGVKVNGQQLSADRAGAISSTLTGKFQQAGRLEGGAEQAILFAAVKNQLEKDTGKQANILDVMKQARQGATGSNLKALEAQMNRMGMNETEKVLLMDKLGNTGSIDEARALAKNGFGTAKEGAGQFATTTTATSQLQAKGENLLLGKEAANIAGVRHSLQNKMLDYAGSTAKGVGELVKIFNEFFGVGGDKKKKSEAFVAAMSGNVQIPAGYQMTPVGLVPIPGYTPPKTTSAPRGRKK